MPQLRYLLGYFPTDGHSHQRGYCDFHVPLRDGSTWCHWGTRLQPIRTASEINAKIVIKPFTSMPLYQKLAQKIRGLFELGMNVTDIAKSLRIAKKTVRKARQFYNNTSAG